MLTADDIRDLNARVLDGLAARERAARDKVEELAELLRAVNDELTHLQSQQQQLRTFEALQLAALESSEPTDVSTAVALSPSPMMTIVEAVLANGRVQSPEHGSDEAQVDVGEKQKLRARIGPQRYIILAMLRMMGPLSLDGRVDLTKLSAKRVRDQLRSDVPRIIGEVYNSSDVSTPPKYDLTAEGGDLLSRYETYKKTRNEPLPTMEDAAADEGQSGDTEVEGAATE